MFSIFQLKMTINHWSLSVRCSSGTYDWQHLHCKPATKYMIICKLNVITLVGCISSAASETVQQMAAYVISDHSMGLQLCRYFSGHPVGNSQRYTMPFKISEISMLCLNGLPQNASHDLYPLYGVIHEEKCHKNCHGYHI